LVDHFQILPNMFLNLFLCFCLQKFLLFSFIFKGGGGFVEWTRYLLNKLWIYYLSFKASHDFICFLLSLLEPFMS
jgi:hypothetical protein